MLKLEKHTEYYHKDTRVSIRFIPVKNVPGFSHRVIIRFDSEQVATDWLGDDFTITEKNARYYFKKHIEAIKKAIEKQDHFLPVSKKAMRELQAESSIN